MPEQMLHMPNVAGWPVKRLDILCSLISRGKGPDYVDSSPVLAIGQRCVTDQGFEPSYARPHDARVLSGHLAPLPGDVLLNSTGTGTIGRSSLFDVDGSYIVDSHVTVLRPEKNEASGEWLNAVLRTAWGQQHLERYCFTGSTNQVELSRSELSRTALPVPTYAEQTKIAQILDTLDTQIRQTEALIAKLEHIKQGLLTDLLTRGIDQNGQLRPTPDQAPHLYKDSSLGRIPKEWAVSNMGNLLSDLEPAMRSGPFGSALLKSELVESGIPLLGIDNVYAEQFRSAYSRFVTRQKFLELSRYAVRPHDLMITIMGTVGRCCLVPEYIGDALSSKHTWTITLDTNKYVPYLAMLQINYAPWALRHLARDEQGGIMSAIRSETLRSLQLPVPPIEEQKVISARLTSISQRIETEGDTAIQLKLVKQGLMDDLLTGRVRVTPLLGDTKPQQAGHLNAGSGAHTPKAIMHHDTL